MLFSYSSMDSRWIGWGCDGWGRRWSCAASNCPFWRCNGKSQRSSWWSTWSWLFWLLIYVDWLHLYVVLGFVSFCFCVCLVACAPSHATRLIARSSTSSKQNYLCMSFFAGWPWGGLLASFLSSTLFDRLSGWIFFGRRRPDTTQHTKLSSFLQKHIIYQISKVVVVVLELASVSMEASSPSTLTPTIALPWSIPRHRRTSREETAQQANVGASIRLHSDGKIAVIHPISVMDRQRTICLMPECECALQR